MTRFPLCTFCSWLFLLFLVLGFSKNSDAASPLSLTYQGRIIQPDGMPLTSSNVRFTIEIKSHNDCLLYKEIQTVNMSSSAGVFSLSIGSAPSPQTFNYVGTSLASVFTNRGNFSGLNGCTGGTYTPNNDDNRQISVSFEDLTLSIPTMETIPVQTVSYVPFAIETYQIAGYTSQSLLRVDGGTATALTPANFTELMALLNGTSNQYVTSSNNGVTSITFAGGDFTGGTVTSTGAVALKDIVTGATKGSATKIPQITYDNKGRITAVSEIDITGASPGGAAGGDLSGTYPNPTIGAGKIDTSKLADDSVTSAKIKDGEIVNADISASAGITDTKLATIATVGKVANSATTGTSSNTANTLVLRDANGDFSSRNITANQINSTETYATDLYLRNAGNKTVKFNLDPAVAANFNIVWPANPGSTGKVLTNDGNGNLSWSTMDPGSSGTVTNITAGTGLNVGAGPGGSITSIGTLNVNVGTGANQIVQLNGSSQLPTLDASLLTNLNPANLSSVVPIAKGGTGQSTQTAAFNALSPLTNKGDLITSDGTNNVRFPVGSNFKYLRANSSQSSGLEYSDVTAVDLASLSSTGIVKRTGASTYTTLGVTAPLVDTGTNIGLSLGTGLTTSGGNLVVDVGTSANKIPQLDGSGKLNPSVLPSGTATQWTTTGSDIYYNTGNVGIGITTPTIGKLQINASGSTPAIFINGKSSSDLSSEINIVRSSSASTVGNGPNIRLDDNIPANSNIIQNSQGALTFWNYGAGSWNERVRISTNGNVGIGTTAPLEKLEVVGNIKATQLCIGTDCRSAWPGSGGGGTVTSVTAGTGLTTSPGGGITGAGSVSIAAGGVSATELATNAVTTAKILDGNVTGVKLETLAGLTAATYGSATAVPAITVDTKGRITAITTNNITGLLPTASGVSGKYLKSDGTNWSAQDIHFSDIKNIGGTSAFNVGSCAANQTVAWSSLTDTFTCQNIGSLDASTITTGTLNAARLPSSVTDGLWSASSGNAYRSTGNIGIGTSNPTEALHVNSSSATAIKVSGTSAYLRLADSAEEWQLGVNALGAGAGKFTLGKGSPYMTVDTSGNVGIGTTSPLTNFHIAKKSNIATHYVGDLVNGFTNNNNGVSLSAYSDGSNYVDFKTYTGGKTYFRTGEGTETGAQRTWMTVNSSNGYLGIGTTSPIGPLHVEHNLNAQEYVYIKNSSTGSAANTGLLLSNDAGNGVVLTAPGSGNTSATFAGINTVNWGMVGTNNAANGLLLYSGASGPIAMVTNGSERLRINTSGNVGIGTTSPTAKLHIQGGTLFMQGLYDGTNRIAFSDTSTGKAWELYPTTAQGFNLYNRTDGTTPFMVANNGYVGIGTVSPSYNLTVTSAGSVSGYTVISNNNSASGGLDWRWYSSSSGAPLGANAMCLGTNSCHFVLYSTGNATLNGTLTQSSDIRLKRDIASISNALDSVSKVTGVTYYWKDSGKEQSKQMGLIAQDVENVFPEAVKTDTLGFKSIAYQNLVAPIINAIKEIRDWMFKTDERIQILEEARKQDQEALENLKKQNENLKTYLCQKDPKAPLCR